MKKISLLLISLVLVSFVGESILAQEIQEPAPLVPEIVLPELPDPGLVPGDFFYFLDEWSEAIEEFFTFNDEARAILQTERALERIAEVNALLEREGVDAPGLAVAEASIQRNMARANEILEEQKTAGIEVAALAARLESDFDVRRKTLNQVFNSRKDSLAKQGYGIRKELRQARAEENLNKALELRSALDGARIQKEKLAQRRDVFQDNIVSENIRIRDKMEQSAKELRILEQEREILEDAGERTIERVFEEREMAIENKEEVLEIQLNQAILAGDREEVKIIYNNLREIELQTEALEIEEYLFEEKIEAEIAEIETAIEIILETRDDQDELRIMANKAKTHAKELITKALAKIEEQNMHDNSAIIGLVKQAERFHERGLILFEKGEYKKSYLASRKAMDFAGKAFKLINVKENLRKEKPDLPDDIIHIEPIIVPVPVPDEGYDLEREKVKRVKKQIKTAERLIEKTRQAMNHKDVEGIAFPIVAKLIEKAENNIDKAEALLKQGVFNSAHRHAIEARGMAEKAYKIMQQKLETGETIIIPDPTEMPMRCQTNADCKHLICTMVIGNDTPQCNREIGKCFCGPGRNFEKRQELERLR